MDGLMDIETLISERDAKRDLSLRIAEEGRAELKEKEKAKEPEQATTEAAKVGQ